MACRCLRKPHISDFGFKVDDFSVFHRPQWPKIPQLAVTVYRVVVTLYILGFFTGLMVITIRNQYGFTFVYLTMWAFLIFILYNLLATFNSIWDGFVKRRDASEEGPQVRHQIHWFLFAVTTNLNFLVTIVYWSALHEPSIPLVYDLTMHTLTSVVCLVDLLATAVPVRLLHFVYPVAVGSAYVLFTLVLWAGFGEDSVYFFLDYTDHPGAAAGAIVAILAAVVLMQCLVWGVYRLRLRVWSRYFRSDVSRLPRTESISDVPVNCGEETTDQDVSVTTARI